MFFLFAGGIVIVYSAMAERLNPQDLIYGTVRKPAAPLAIGHEKLVGRLHTALDAYVTPRSLGRLWAGVAIGAKASYFNPTSPSLSRGASRL